MLEKHSLALDPAARRSSLSRSSSARPPPPWPGPTSSLYIFAWPLLYFPSALSGRIKGPGLIFRTAEVEEVNGGEGEKCLSTHLKQQPAWPPLRGGVELFTAAGWREGLRQRCREDERRENTGWSCGPCVGRTAGGETAGEEDTRRLAIS